ncbi:energy transducer TonB [Hyphobacterium marinum]|uniref:Energy transducer TonB n=1 Tax=Hyphobacterium marinum TaxID=3116574 RepID=A0ABU7LUC4_9PROT|nr:energy transducer TonB [Hyphobacterium sp. Y6023]MEE2565139.1 energy transducer TonB [Hyphobacterium sp. Y6023]
MTALVWALLLLAYPGRISMLKVFAAALACVMAMTGQAAARQDGTLPAEVLDAYSAYEAAVAASDWEQAVRAARTAAEAGDRHGTDAATRAVLWENLGIAYLRYGIRPETEGLADRAFEQALTQAQAIGDEPGTLRLRFRLIEAALSAQEGMLALDRMGEFERALARSSTHAPDLERQYLAMRLHGMRPPSFFYAPPLSDDDRARVARLLELAESGSREYLIAQYRLVVDAYARQDWPTAEALVFATAAETGRRNETIPDTLANILSIYHEVLARGFDDTESSGAARWPDESLEIWCAYLVGRALPIRTPPQYPARAAEFGWTGSVTMTFWVDEFGHLVEIISAEPVGRTNRAFIPNSERALRRWQWRPQCRPREGVTMTDSTVLSYEMRE